MGDKERLLKRIADLFWGIVTFLGLILGWISLDPSNRIDTISILIITGIIFFTCFVFLITYHTSKLEEKINKLEKEISNERRLGEIEKDIKIIKEKRK